MAGIPLLAFIVAAYTALALVAPGWLEATQFSLPLLSRTSLPFQGGDLLLVCNSDRLRSRFSLTGLDRAMVVQARVALPRHHAGERNGTSDRRDQKSS